jgi:hypothetical protein
MYFIALNKSKKPKNQKDICIKVSAVAIKAIKLEMQNLVALFY